MEPTKNTIPDSFSPFSAKTTSNASIISLFIALELTGAIGMFLILLTALVSCVFKFGSNPVKRLATWYTFCISWIISCISYSLLYFTGDIRLSEPRKAICVTQAALVYSVPSLTASSTLALLVHSWYNVHFGLSKPPLESNLRVIMVLLLVPFVLWTLLLTGLLVFGIKSPSLVHNFGLYCTFMQILPSKISSLFVIITTFSTVPIQVSLGISLCRNFDRTNTTSAISSQTRKMVIRVLAFSFLILIGFAEALIHLLTLYRNTAVDIIMALLPVFGVLIFGIQRDLFQTWFSWIGILSLPATKTPILRIQPPCTYTEPGTSLRMSNFWEGKGFGEGESYKFRSAEIGVVYGRAGAREAMA